MTSIDTGETKSITSITTTAFTTSLPDNFKHQECYNESVELMENAKKRNEYTHYQPPAPSCSKNHRMYTSEFSGGGYQNGYGCDICNEFSSNGHLGGAMKRWYCPICSADICLICHPIDMTDCPSCLHERTEGWKLDQCAECKKCLGELRLKSENAFAEAAKVEDIERIKIQSHAERINSLGIRVDALVSFVCTHDCWNWPTWQVVRDIIVPATRDSRCRYGDLPKLRKCFGKATIFMSHCWGSNFGDLVGAACHGAQKDRIVWIDIFAVRQWPGNIADLDFRGVIDCCNAVIVSVSPLDVLNDKYFGDLSKLSKFLSSPAGQTAKTKNPFLRLWCVVELAAAIERNVPVVVKCGKVEPAREQTANDTCTYQYITMEMENGEDANFMLSNLCNMIDVERSECAVQADYIREINTIRNLSGGIQRVNQLVTSVVLGAIASTRYNITEIDAFVCGEKESLNSLIMRSGSIGDELNLAEKVLTAACNGGRSKVVHSLLQRWRSAEVAIVTATAITTGETKRKEDVSADTSSVGDSGWLKTMIDNRKILVSTASGGHTTCTRMLLDVKGIDVNIAIIKSGVTPLYQVCCKGHFDILILLLSHSEIKINQSETINGCTPLWIACQNAHIKVVDQLLKTKDIDVNKGRTDNSCTPLFIAAQDGKVKIVERLLSVKNIQVNQSDAFGSTPLSIACQHGQTEVVRKLLLHSDIDFNLGAPGWPPLRLATQLKHLDIVELLTTAGATL